MTSTSTVAAVDFGSGLSQAWQVVVTSAPRLLGFLLVLVIGWFVARLLAKAVNAVLERVGFDRVVERGGVKTALARSEYDASDVIAKLVRYAVLLITLQLAFGVWGSNPVSQLLGDIVAWLPRAAVAIVIVVVAAAIAKAAKDFITNAMGGLSYGKVVATAASVFVVGLGVIAALNQVGVATTVTTPVLITVLATIGGIAVIGVGGGLIKPMQQRWTRWLDRAEQEIPRMREQVEANTARRQAEQQRAAYYQQGFAHAAHGAHPAQAVPAGPPRQSQYPPEQPYGQGQFTQDWPAQPGYHQGTIPQQPTGGRQVPQQYAPQHFPTPDDHRPNRY
ncbi:CmpX [Actinokineospora spheciospongiae]|uniref:CmpX n=1 Tax=Actinokineospora spheciospongiae TaxID=909613 RepID=W7ISX3_9PSEU|nr:CmpX [Actinokineospora spheciospongiae]